MDLWRFMKYSLISIKNDTSESDVSLTCTRAYRCEASAMPMRWKIISLLLHFYRHLFVFSNWTYECGTYRQLQYWSNNFDDFAVSWCYQSWSNLSEVSDFDGARIMVVGLTDKGLDSEMESLSSSWSNNFDDFAVSWCYHRSDASEMSDLDGARLTGCWSDKLDWEMESLVVVVFSPLSVCNMFC